MALSILEGFIEADPSYEDSENWRGLTEDEEEKYPETLGDLFTVAIDITPEKPDSILTPMSDAERVIESIRRGNYRDAASILNLDLNYQAQEERGVLNQ